MSTIVCTTKSQKSRYFNIVLEPKLVFDFTSNHYPLAIRR